MSPRTVASVRTNTEIRTLDPGLTRCRPSANPRVSLPKAKVPTGQSSKLPLKRLAHRRRQRAAGEMGGEVVAHELVHVVGCVMSTVRVDPAIHGPAGQARG